MRMVFQATGHLHISRIHNTYAWLATNTSTRLSRKQGSKVSEAAWNTPTSWVNYSRRQKWARTIGIVTRCNITPMLFVMSLNTTAAAERSKGTKDEHRRRWTAIPMLHWWPHSADNNTYASKMGINFTIGHCKSMCLVLKKGRRWRSNEKIFQQ